MINTKCPECQFDQPEKYGHGMECSKHEDVSFECICLNYSGQNGLCKTEGHKDLFEKYKKEHYNKEKN